MAEDPKDPSPPPVESDVPELLRPVVRVVDELTKLGTRPDDPKDVEARARAVSLIKEMGDGLGRALADSLGRLADKLDPPKPREK